MTDFATMTIRELARTCRKDWASPYFGAVPYLSAMSALETVDDAYGYDSGRSIVMYFLGNARGWRGDVAKAVKAELKRRLK